MEIIEFRKKIGVGLQHARKRLGLNQSDIADHFGVSVTAVSKWERGQVAMPADTFLDLCEFLEVSPDAIVGNSPGGISYDEMMIIESYRKAAPDRQESILLLLGLEKKAVFNQEAAG